LSGQRPAAGKTLYNARLFQPAEVMPVSTLPPCPKCNSEYTYEDGTQLVCPECAHEWTPGAAAEASDGERVIKDSVGNLLQDGDSVSVINAPFSAETGDEEISIPFYSQPWFWDIVKQILGVLFILVLVFGVLVARFINRMVFAYLNNMGVEGALTLSTLAEYAVIIFVVFVALEQLQIGTHLLISAFQIGFGAVGLAMALAFGLGGKDWAASVIKRLTEKK
jgi:hypothetical protein